VLVSVVPLLSKMFHYYSARLFVAVVDISLYEAKFEGMKLSGLVMVACGFIIVLFPENWPDAIQHVVR